MSERLHYSELFPDWRPIELDGGPAPPSGADGVETLDESRPPAQVEAPPLAPDVRSPAYLGELLTEAARRHPEAGTTYVQPGRPERFQPLSELLAEARAILRGLRRDGLQPGEKVLLQMTDLPTFYGSFWGCVLGGFIPVPLAIPPDFASNEGHGRRLHALWRLLRQPLILTEARHRSGLESALTSLDPAIRVAAADEWTHLEPDADGHRGAAEDPILMLLTSGSTGVPKLVMLSTQNVLGMIRGNLPLVGLRSSDTFLNWIPHEHVGAMLFFHVFPIFLGCHQVHLAAQRVIADPVEWVKSLARYRNVVSVAPNFLFGLLNQRFEEIRLGGWDLSSVKVLINAGEPIVPRTARKFLRLFATLGLSPEVMRPSFGMSETCSGITWGRLDPESTSDGDPFASVGVPIHGASLRIVSEEGSVLPEGVDGRVQVKGPSVFAGYHENPEANRESFTEDGWLDTGDSGFLSEGQLYVTGRSKNVIIVNGNNYYCHEIEATIEELPEVRASYTAACACRPLGSETDELAVFFTPAEGVEPLDETVLEKIRRKVLRQVALNPKFLIPLAPEDLPKTSWGKVQHATLRQRFHRGTFNPILREIDLRAGEENLVPAWFWEKHWQPLRAAGARAAGSATGPSLLFAASDPASSSLAALLEEEGAGCITVTRGHTFERLGRHCYRLDAEDETHVALLFRRLAEEQPPVAQVLYLWAWEEAGLPEAGVESVEELVLRSLMPLVRICRELVRHRGTAGSVVLRVLTAGRGGDEVDDASAGAGALSSGWLKSVAREIPWLDCQLIHCRRPAAAEPPPRSLLEELRSPVHEPEIALEGDRRLAPRLRKAVFDLARYDSTFFDRPDVFYLVTGGLGGVGTELVQHLLARTEARFLCVGRTPRSELDGAAEAGAQRALLEGAGDRALYREADVCDLEALSAAVEAARGRWGRGLGGILHLAGAYEEKPLAEVEEEHVWRALRPKVLGALVLSRLMERHGARVFLSFSSAIGYLGGSMVGAYAAGATFLESFHHHLRRRGFRSHCFSWSLWDELGISRGYRWKKLLEERGYLSIPVKQGIASFLAGVFYGKAHLWIGLDERVFEGSEGEPAPAVRQDDGRPRRSVEDILSLSAPAEAQARPPGEAVPGMAFSFLFFSDVREDLSDAEKYGLLRDLTRFGDREGFTAVYLPERHFYEFGSIYANPAIVAAYLIPQTRRIRFRTAGVSLPLHHPAEVVEWWSMNDVLSGGRVDLGFGSGWNRDDFVFSPETYERRRAVCSEQIPIVQKLWRGETVSFAGPGGEELPITTYPRPIQESLNVWLLISQSDEAFAYAGRQGYNVFTMLYGIHLQALEEKIALYRQGREEAGLDPHGGTVSLMLHTLIHRDLQTVRDAVEKPFKEYIKSAFEAHARSVVHPGMEGMAEVGEKEKDKILGYAYERYFKTAALFGTVEEGRKVVEEAIRIGVDEIACLMDFGVDYPLVKDSLPYLKQLTSGYVGRSTGSPSEPGGPAVALGGGGPR